eukprot:gene5924-6610_t
MAASSRNAKKSKDILNKKIPENPRYKHIGATVDTGSSVTKYLGKIEDLRKNYRLRKDEIFKRMKASTFAQLVLQVAEVVNLELERERLSTAGTLIDETGNGYSHDVPPLPLDKEDVDKTPPNSSRSTLQEVISGVGEMQMKESNTNETPRQNADLVEFEVPETSSLPYLLLDVRDKDAFDQCHIIGAQNYPSAMLSRSVNYFTKDILDYLDNKQKNKAGKIIVLYDEDERIAPGCATIFVQRDVENVLMLSGGMKVISKKFPGCFTTGMLPNNCIATPPPSRKGKPKTPGRDIKQENEQKHLDWYTSDHIMKIQDLVDEELLREDNSRMSSRLTTRSTLASKASARSTASQNSNRSDTSSRHWR